MASAVPFSKLSDWRGDQSGWSFEVRRAEKVSAEDEGIVMTLRSVGWGLAFSVRVLVPM